MYDRPTSKNSFKSCKKTSICYYARNRLINTEVVPDVPELDIVDLDPDCETSREEVRCTHVQLLVNN